MGSGGRQGYATALTMLLLCLAPAARAQVSLTLDLKSDYRFRGLSLSNRGPTLSAALAYDHPSGFYVGGAVIGEDDDGPQVLGTIEYAGFATARTPLGVAFDLGVNNENLSTSWRGRRLPLNYSEVYVGVIGRHLSAHLSYSPDFVRSGYATLYADIEGAYKPADDWRLFAQLGTTVPLGGDSPRAQRYDLRAGVARKFGALEIQAAITTTSPNPPTVYPQGRAALVLGASYAF